jgi:hypothetical protein
VAILDVREGDTPAVTGEPQVIDPLLWSAR